MIPALLLAMVFVYTDVGVPEWLTSTTRMIGNLTVPLMLITLGVALSSLRVRNIKTAFLLSIIRLGMGFGVGVLVTWVLDLEGVYRGVVILQCAMPAAVFSYLFAQLYQQRAEDVAGVVLMSSFISFPLLPFLLLFVL